MASKKAEKKGNSVELGTFRSWGKKKIFGVKTVEDTKSGRTMVNFIWCKVCAKHEKAIMSSPLVKGSAKNSVQSFIDGTNSVTKFQVCKFS